MMSLCGNRVCPKLYNSEIVQIRARWVLVPPLPVTTSRDFERIRGRSYVEAKGDFLYIVPILRAARSISPR
jgi:hypothetical protein